MEENVAVVEAIVKEIMKENKTIAFDFDGVIHRYSRGWQDGTIYDKPVDGIKETIDKLRKEGYEIVIYSTRASSIAELKDMNTWLRKHEIKVDDICSEKPIALMYVDDRAIPFNGNCETLMKNIHNFKVWTDKAKSTCPYCGTEFYIDDIAKGRRKYCSIECRVKANIEKEIKKGE